MRLVSVILTYYTYVQTQANRVCNSPVILLWLMLPRDHFVSRFLCFTSAGVKCCVAAVKSCPYFISVLLYFSGPSESLMPALLIECWELSTAQPMLWAWGMLHVFIIPHVKTFSNRVCNSLVILLWLMLPRDHFVSRGRWESATRVTTLKVFFMSVLNNSLVLNYSTLGRNMRRQHQGCYPKDKPKMPPQVQGHT
jgi:hypothetical protein